MRTEQLQCFQAIYTHRSFSKAADSIYISQSALSKQIRSLENELGVTLFKRFHSATVPTEVGLAIAPHVERILSELDLMEDICRTGSARRASCLKIATFFNVSYSPVAVNMIQFEQQIPGFHIETLECSHAQMNSTFFKNSQIEICFGFSELWDIPGEYSFYPLQTTPLSLVVNVRHPLARYNSIRLSEIRNEYFCFSKEDSALFDYYISSCKSAGFSPLLTNSTVRLGLIKQYIASNLRCTLSPMIVAQEFFTSSRFKVIEVTDAKPLTLTMIAINPSTHSHGKAFVKAMVDAFAPNHES